MKKNLFIALIAAFVVIVAEIFSFAFTLVAPNQFRPSAADISSRLTQEKYEFFLSISYDPVTGWENPRGGTRVWVQCLGKKATYTFDKNGARTTGGGGAPEIMTIGDSNTRGDEVDDHESYPSQLEKLTNRGVVNYGVGGFGPLQEVLQFERKIKLHPTVKVAVLGIAYSNIDRMVNSFRPALVRFADARFGFKPYVKIDGPTPVFMNNPNAPPASSIEELHELIAAALENDYWRKPDAGFPFTASMIEMIVRKPSRQLLFGRLGSALGFSPYAKFFRDADFLAGLESVIRRFVASAKKSGVRPIVFFLPSSEGDLDSPTKLINKLRGEIAGIEIHNLGEANIDWVRYKDDPSCHPSPYGYNAIAKYVQKLLD